MNRKGREGREGKQNQIFTSGETLVSDWKGLQVFTIAYAFRYLRLFSFPLHPSRPCMFNLAQNSVVQCSTRERQIDRVLVANTVAKHGSAHSVYLEEPERLDGFKPA